MDLGVGLLECKSSCVPWMHHNNINQLAIWKEIRDLPTKDLFTLFGCYLSFSSATVSFIRKIKKSIVPAWYTLHAILPCFWGDFFLGGSWVFHFHDPSLRAHYFMDDLFTGEHKDEQNQLCKEGIDGRGRGRERLHLPLPLSPRISAVSFSSLTIRHF